MDNLIRTIEGEDYSSVHSRVYDHDGCVVDVGCLGWDWSGIFIGKKRVIGIDPFEEDSPPGTELFQGVLGPMNGETALEFQNLGSSVFQENSWESSKTFTMLNWKTFCNWYHIDKVSVLKLNIEGSEYPLLNSLDKGDFDKIDQIAVSFHNWMNSEWDALTAASIKLLEEVGFQVECIYERLGWYLAVKKPVEVESIKVKDEISMNKNVTIVTGLWDLGRGDLDDSFKRDFQQYKDRFFELIDSDCQMCVWIPKDLEEEVLKIRGDRPTKIYYKELKEFETWNPFFDKIQEIRNKPGWADQVGWLKESPQARLKYYNPMMFTKMFMVNDSAILNPFNSEYFFWIDGGITSTVHKGYFQHDLVFDNLENYVSQIGDKFIQLAYPYEGSTEIHGFEREALARYCNTDYVKYVCRGGFFGGPKAVIHDLNNLYYSIMNSTLAEGYMGADECLFTILSHLYPELTYKFNIEGNGLVWPFFEELKEYKEKPAALLNGKKSYNDIKTSVYVLTFNYPSQFRDLCESFKKADPNFLLKPSKILINNSTDRTTDEEYDELCKEYGFEEIHQDNIGICGGRQLCAEHFDKSDNDYYIFFEDDMFLYSEEVKTVCKNGFTNYIHNLYDKTLRIMYKNDLDYLKLSFSEIYGDSTEQWAWYNVPQSVREQYFPDKTALPVHGLDPNAPKTEFEHMGKHEDCRFLTGDIHYCNWPLWFSKEGNKKVFLETTWSRPYEQTWMSYVFQKQKKGEIKAAVLLASPINHTRNHYYKPEERVES
jgi:hypothetical protein